MNQSKQENSSAQQADFSSSSTESFWSGFLNVDFDLKEWFAHLFSLSNWPKQDKQDKQEPKQQPGAVPLSKEFSTEEKQEKALLFTVRWGMQKYLKVLGVEVVDGKQLSWDVVREAYKKKILATHPDKGGSAEEFSQARDAFVGLEEIVRDGVEGKFEKALMAQDQEFRQWFAEISVKIEKMKKWNEKMKKKVEEREERMKEREERMKEQEERMKEQQERMKEQQEIIRKSNEEFQKKFEEASKIIAENLKTLDEPSKMLDKGPELFEKCIQQVQKNSEIIDSCQYVLDTQTLSIDARKEKMVELSEAIYKNSEAIDSLSLERTAFFHARQKSLNTEGSFFGRQGLFAASSSSAKIKTSEALIQR